MNVNAVQDRQVTARGPVGTAERRNVPSGTSVRRNVGTIDCSKSAPPSGLSLVPPFRRPAVPPCRRPAVPPSRRTHVPSSRRPAVPPGFTLIEILVVITVIAILAGLVSPMVFRNVGDAKVTAAKAQIEMLGLALDSYRMDNDYYPSTLQGLAALQAVPTSEPIPRRWRGPYLRRAIPLDPWGNPYHYQSPGTAAADGYDLASYGRDGRAGGSEEDQDIASWEPASR